MCIIEVKDHRFQGLLTHLALTGGISSTKTRHFWKQLSSQDPTIVQGWLSVAQIGWHFASPLLPPLSQEMVSCPTWAAVHTKGPLPTEVSPTRHWNVIFVLLEKSIKNR